MSNVMLFQSDDPELAAAVAEAQATLDTFRQKIAEAPQTKSLAMLKAPIGEGEGKVFLWLVQVQVTPEGFSAVATAVPPEVTAIAKGDRVVLPAELVQDWMVNDQGIVHGGFSLRLHRSRLPEDQRAAFDEQIGVTRFI